MAAGRSNNSRHPDLQSQSCSDRVPNITRLVNLKFAPGAGTIPPVLAGREREKVVIAEALEDLRDEFNLASNIALICPRGNGRTALLRWVDAHVDQYKGSIKCAALNPAVSGRRSTRGPRDVFGPCKRRI